MAEKKSQSDEEAEAAYGWQSDLPTFYGTQPRVVRVRLEEFIRDAGTGQILWRPWRRESSHPAKAPVCVASRTRLKN